MTRCGVFGGQFSTSRLKDDLDCDAETIPTRLSNLAAMRRAFIALAFTCDFFRGFFCCDHCFNMGPKRYSTATAIGFRHFNVSGGVVL